MIDAKVSSLVIFGINVFLLFEETIVYFVLKVEEQIWNAWNKTHDRYIYYIM